MITDNNNDCLEILCPHFSIIVLLFHVCLLPCLTKNKNGHVLLYILDFLYDKTMNRENECALQ